MKMINMIYSYAALAGFHISMKLVYNFGYGDPDR